MRQRRRCFEVACNYENREHPTNGFAEVRGPTKPLGVHELRCLTCVNRAGG